MHDALLELTQRRAREFLSTVADRHVGTRANRDELIDALGGPLPEDPVDPAAVIDHLARAADPGVVASAGPRYFGFVTGGSHPAALAADWLVSTWDQNAALYVMSPAVSVIEDVTAAWLLDVLGLPERASVGFVTGAHMANVTALAAARHEVLRQVGWDVEAKGMREAPIVHVVVGDEAHVSIFAALRLLGFGTATIRRVSSDDQGRLRPEALADELERWTGPTIVCAQAGHVSTGAFDPFPAIVDVTRRNGAWLHVDGAFGLWAAASPSRRHLLAGVEGADSWTTDAHKWLNVPYDCGIVVCAHSGAHRAAMSQLAAYLIRGTDEQRNGMDWVPESSRRARAVPVYAVMKALGRRGIADLIDRCCVLAARMADHLRAERDFIILNDVVLNQVLVGWPDRFPPIQIARIQREGVCWFGETVWKGRNAARISVSNWSTTQEDIDRSARAIILNAREVKETRVTEPKTAEP
jgi:glutamate/tyrosine decarboxylase-like PLP-dependent enzyme